MRGRSPGPEGRPGDGEWGPAPVWPERWARRTPVMCHTAPCAAATGLTISAGHEPSTYSQVMRSTWKGEKTQTARDGFKSDGVGMRAELSEKVTCGASSEGWKEASECRSAVTTQREQQVGWPRGQSIPLTFLAPQDADQASRSPWPLHAGVPHLSPITPTLLRRLLAPLVSVFAIVVGSPSRSECSGHPVPSTGTGQPGAGLRVSHQKPDVHVQKILAGLPDAVAGDH